MLFLYHYLGNLIELSSFVLFLGGSAYLRSQYYYNMTNISVEIFTMARVRLNCWTFIFATNVSKTGCKPEMSCLFAATYADYQISLPETAIMNRNHAQLHPVAIFIQDGGWTVCRK
jgi:hypothetical protein